MNKKTITLFLIFFQMITWRNTHADLDAWPLLELSEDSTTICYPLYVKEKNFQMIFPIYFNTNEGNDYHFFWPMVKISERRLQRALPVWYTESDAFTLFPLIRQTPEYTFWSIPPMYFDKKGSFSAVIPLYIKNDNKKFIFPNIYYQKKNNNLTNFKLFPIVDYVNDTNLKSIDIFYLLGKKQKKDFFSKWFLPFYYSSKQQRKEILWALPYFYNKNVHQISQGIVPIYQKTEGQGYQSFRIFNYYQEVTPKRETTGFFPLYQFQQSKLSRCRTENVFDLFWFIYRKKTITSESNKLLERTRRFLIFSDELKNDGRRLFKILDTIVSERVGNN